MNVIFIINKLIRPRVRFWALVPCLLATEMVACQRTSPDCDVHASTQEQGASSPATADEALSYPELFLRAVTKDDRFRDRFLPANVLLSQDSSASPYVVAYADAQLDHAQLVFANKQLLGGWIVIGKGDPATPDKAIHEVYAVRPGAQPHDLLIGHQGDNPCVLGWDAALAGSLEPFEQLANTPLVFSLCQQVFKSAAFCESTFPTVYRLGLHLSGQFGGRYVAKEWICRHGPPDSTADAGVLCTTASIPWKAANGAAVNVVRYRVALRVQAGQTSASFAMWGRPTASPPSAARTWNEETLAYHNNGWESANGNVRVLADGGKLFLSHVYEGNPLVTKEPLTCL